MSFANPFEQMRDMLQQDPKPMELIICAKCKTLNTWLTIRKILDSKGDFLDYLCGKCATERRRLE